jgi:hypothetical protein
VSPESKDPFLFYRGGKDPSAEVEFYFGAGDRKVRLKAAARAAIELAGLLEQVEEEELSGE